MSEQTRTANFEIEITLLEDLHTGSGMGSVVVDRLLARAADGTPIIAREHLKGVWRDNALRLNHLGRLGPKGADLIRDLFGSADGARGGLIAPELRPQSPAASLHWDATARKPGDRAPDDHSLRRTEYLSAGTCLKGRGSLSPDRPELRKALEQIVRFTNALGSERTRGSGLITATIKWTKAPKTILAPTAGQSTDLSGGLRLLLRAEAPLCIPTTGAPGNIIASEHHLPGRTLFGALAQWIGGQGHKADVLFDRRLCIGPAYPLPTDHDCADSTALGTIQVIPMPLNIWTPKPAPRPQSLWPHWATAVKVGADTPGEAKARFRDMFAPTDDTGEDDETWRPDKTRYKRPKSNAYLVRSAGTAWRCYEAPLGLRMRNRRGDPIEPESGPVLEQDTALFTVEQMPTGTHFVADIRPSNPSNSNAVKELADYLALLLDPAAQAAPLRIGRGGAPVAIVGWSPLPAAPEHPDDSPPTGRLTITLTTDLIVRTPDLGFHTELTVQAILDCLGDTATWTERPKTRGYSDSARYIGFNATAGLPGAPRVAIRRGSALQVEGEAASALRGMLQGGAAIGDQTWEGNGRFVLDLAPVAQGIEDANPTATPPTDQAALDRARHDRVIAAARKLCENNKTLDWLPGPAQLGNLRAWLAAAPPERTPDQVGQLLDGYKTTVEQRRGREEWAKVFGEIGLLGMLRDACCEGEVCRTQDLELYLRVLTLRKKQSEPHDGTPETHHSNDGREGSA